MVRWVCNLSVNNTKKESFHVSFSHLMAVKLTYILISTVLLHNIVKRVLINELIARGFPVTSIQKAKP